MKKTREGQTTMKLLAVRIPEALATRAKVRAARDKTTLQALMTQALVRFLRTPGQTEGGKR
jgi:predicted HicB family RNase H-like nuclease